MRVYLHSTRSCQTAACIQTRGGWTWSSAYAAAYPHLATCSHRRQTITATAIVDKGQSRQLCRAHVLGGVVLLIHDMGTTPLRAIARVRLLARQPRRLARLRLGGRSRLTVRLVDGPFRSGELGSLMLDAGGVPSSDSTHAAAHLVAQVTAADLGGGRLRLSPGAGG